MIKIDTAKGEIKEMMLQGTTSELCADVALLVYSFYSDLKKQNPKMAKEFLGLVAHAISTGMAMAEVFKEDEESAENAENTKSTEDFASDFMNFLYGEEENK